MKEKIEKWVEYNDRQSSLIACRNLKMAGSANSYVRGNTTKFYEWLQKFAKQKIPEGPAIWICGDCHFGNLGPVADARGRVAIQIRDLDQTVIGNPAYDLIRLGLSLAMSARGSDLPGVITAKILEQLIDGYEQGMAPDGNLSNSIEKPDTVQSILKKALHRSWKSLAKERLRDTCPTIPLGSQFWPLTKAEKLAIANLFEEKSVMDLVSLLHSRNNEGRVKVVDAAYWKKGCSSLGFLRYAVLLKYSEKRESTDKLWIMDIKEAHTSVVPWAENTNMPIDHAMRVVEGARNLSPYLGDRIVAGQLLNRSVFLRELLPQDLKLDIKSLTCNEAMEVSKFLGAVVAKAHAAQMDEVTRKNWYKELLRNHTKPLDAPSWLWSSVVGLAVNQEEEYLEHCRKYALSSQS